MQWQTFLDAVINKLRTGHVLAEIKRRRKTEDEVMSCIIAESSVRGLLLLWLDEQFKLKESKSSSTAKQLKDLGNKEFQRKDYPASISLYTKSARHAPPESEDLSIAIANRSAALYYMGMFRVRTKQIDYFQARRISECIRDMDLAIEFGYPKKLQHKLHMRSAQCYLKLRDKKMMEVAVQKAQDILSTCNDLSEKKKEEIKKEVGYLKSLAAEIEAEVDPERSNSPSCLRPELAFGSNKNFPCASAAIDCQYSKQKGRHVIANRNIEKGQVLFVEKPFAFVVLNYDQSNTVCSHCCRDYGYSSVPCNSCCATLYCSMKCLREASSYHKWECLGSQIGIGQQIGIAHLSLKVFLNAANTEDVYKFNEVHKLITNIEKMRADDVLVYGVTALMLTLYLYKFTDFFKTIDLKRAFGNKFCDSELNFDCDLSNDSGKLLYASSILLRHILQLICNGHAITKLILHVNDNEKICTEEQIKVATAIYTSASMMNHSCDPNIINSFDEQYLIVKATKDIPAGGEVLNCYGPHFRRMSKDKRQESLRNQYCFTCTCEPCTSPELQSFMERFNALKCSECNGAVFKLYTTVHCIDCGATPTINYIQELKQAEDLMDSGKAYIDMENEAEALDKLKQCLNVRRSILYKHHEDITATLELIGRVYAMSGRWQESISYLEHSIVGIEERYGSDSIEIANELNKITDICLQYLKEETNTKSKQYKNILKKTRRFLQRAEQIMHLNYGPWNGCCQEIQKKQDQLFVMLKNFNI